MDWFRVTDSSGTSTLYSDGGSRYFINETGVLTVYDGKGSRFRFSPSAWISIQDAEPMVDLPEIGI